MGLWRLLCALQPAAHFKNYGGFLSVSELGCQLFGPLISSLRSPILSPLWVSVLQEIPLYTDVLHLPSLRLSPFSKDYFSCYLVLVEDLDCCGEMSFNYPDPLLAFISLWLKFIEDLQWFITVFLLWMYRKTVFMHNTTWCGISLSVLDFSVLLPWI